MLKPKHTNLHGVHDLPDADLVVGVTGEKNVAVSRPGKSAGDGSLTLNSLRLELVNNNVLLEVVDLDAGGGSSSQPVAAGRESKVEDLVSRRQSVAEFAVVNVPDKSLTVLATGGAQGSVGRQSEGVNVTGVADVVSLQAAAGNIPGLKVSMLVLC